MPPIYFPFIGQTLTKGGVFSVPIEHIWLTRFNMCRWSESAAVSWVMKIVYGWTESVLKESTVEKHAWSGIWKVIEYSFDSFHDIHLQLVKNTFRMLRPTWKRKCQQTKKWTNTNYASAFSYTGGFLVQRSIRGRAAEMGLKISLLV